MHLNYLLCCFLALSGIFFSSASEWEDEGSSEENSSTEENGSTEDYSLETALANIVPCSNPTPLDIVFAIDTDISMKTTDGENASFSWNIRNVLPSLVTKISEKASETRFGLLSFNDEYTACEEDPLLTYSDNFCNCVEVPLGPGKDIIAAFEDYRPRTNDDNEGQDSLGAIVAAVTSNEMGWRTDEKTARVIIVLTNSKYREPEGIDNRICQPEGFSKFVSHSSGYNCAMEDYPTMLDVATILKDNKVFPVFWVPPKLTSLYSSALTTSNLEGLSTSLEYFSNVFKDTFQNLLCQPPSTGRPKNVNVTTSTKKPIAISRRKTIAVATETDPNVTKAFDKDNKRFILGVAGGVGAFTLLGTGGYFLSKKMFRKPNKRPSFERGSMIDETSIGDIREGNSDIEIDQYH